MAGEPISGPFRQLLRRFSPAWIIRTNGERFTQGMIGLVGDIILEAATSALTSSLLADPDSPSDAVTKVAADRRIDRYPTDTTETHRARTLGAWDVWSNPGTEQAMLDQIYLFGYPEAFLLAIVDVAQPRKFFVIVGIEGDDDAPPAADLAVEIFKIVNKFRAAEERADDVSIVTKGRTFGIHPQTGLVHTFGDWGPGITTYGDSSGVKYRDI